MFPILAPKWRNNYILLRNPSAICSRPPQKRTTKDAEIWDESGSSWHLRRSHIIVNRYFCNTLLRLCHSSVHITKLQNILCSLVVHIHSSSSFIISFRSIITKDFDWALLKHCLMFTSFLKTAVKIGFLWRHEVTWQCHNSAAFVVMWKRPQLKPTRDTATAENSPHSLNTDQPVFNLQMTEINIQPFLPSTHTAGSQEGGSPTGQCHHPK